MRYFFIFTLLIIALPQSASAAVTISEIMYDAPGTDAKHEWIEVVADGSTDLSAYKLFENGSNHTLTHYSGSTLLSAGQRAIIADDAPTFKIDFPSYTGPVFDSVFSLANTGEELALKNAAGEEEDAAFYNATDGAAGDGNTLHFANGLWEPGVPSPGSGVRTAATPVTSNAQTLAAVTSDETPKITVTAGDDKVIVVGAAAAFTATAYGIKNEVLGSARYVWNFGNGASKEGKSLMYAYPTPGTYTVTVDASNNGYGATDRLTVTVVPAAVAVTRANKDFIEIENQTEYELDLGLWQLVSGGGVFVLPKYTVVASGEMISFPGSVTALAPTSAKDVALYYPNGVRAAEAPPEVLFMSDTTETIRTEPAPTLYAEVVQPEATTTYTRQLTAAIGETSPEWAWLSFVLVALMVIAGVGALVYLGRKS